MTNNKKILIVVDYQQDFVSPEGALSIPEATNISDNIQKEINSGKYDYIIYTFDTHQKEEYDKSEEKNIFHFPIHCEFGTSGWNFYKIKPNCEDWFKKEIEERKKIPFCMMQYKNEAFFTKNVFDIWEGNEIFEQWFQNMFSTENSDIYICGVATNFCVFMNAIGMKKREYRTSILTNCVKGITHKIDGTIEDSYQKNIEIMKSQKINFI